MNVTLKDFVTSFVRPNTLIRLWYPTSVSCSHESVYNDTNQVWMDHEITNENAKHEFADSIVIGVTDILVHGNYVEAVNIVIKRS